jgi:hypothetical protein
LKRIGELAAYAMQNWLSNESLTISNRCQAYELWPDVDVNREDNSLEGACAAIAALAFGTSIEGEVCLLSENATLEPKKGCIAVPQALLDIWDAGQVSALFDDKQRPILSRYVTENCCNRLIKWQYVEMIHRWNVIIKMKYKQMPKPETWRQLMILWEYLSKEVIDGYDRLMYPGVQILPVQGKDVLYAASEVTRLGEKQLLASSDDWDFLSQYLLVLDTNWPQFLSRQRLEASERKDINLSRQVESSFKLLKVLNLGEAAEVSGIMKSVADKFFSQQALVINDCIRLAHIAATLNVQVSDDFRFVTCDGYTKQAKNNIIADLTADLDTFVTSAYYQSHVLRGDYFQPSNSCTEVQLKQWMRSDRSRLLTFVPLEEMTSMIWRKKDLKTFLDKRTFKGVLNYKFKYDNFKIVDWDFEQSLWDHWDIQAEKDGKFWIRLLDHIIQQPPSHWTKALSARVIQISTTGSTASVTPDNIISRWLIKLRELPCLPDIRGEPHQPAELLRRTPQTETLLEVELFVAKEIDTEANQPFLQLLGVRDTPTGPDRLLERLHALSKSASPPLHEVLKWCHRLDQISNKCSTEDIEAIKNAFKQDEIILTETDGVIGWARLGGAYLASDEDSVPGAPLVHSLVRHLALWQRIEVDSRPTAELAINWLKSLNSGQPLSPEEIRRVRALLPRYAYRIWSECGHWMDIDGKWTSVKNFEYVVTMQSLVTYTHLFTAIKHKTANLQYLSEEQCNQSPFSNIPRLADRIEERFQEGKSGLAAPQQKPWLLSLGEGLSRIIRGDAEEKQRIRELGKRLANTVWVVANVLETTPYIAGTPAGTPRSIPALWRDTKLYIARQSPARIARIVTQELGKAFQNSEINDAIMLCYDRSAEFITEYLEENFKLTPLADIKKEKPVQAELADEPGVPAPTETGEKEVKPPVDEGNTSKPFPKATPEELPVPKFEDEEEQKPKPPKPAKPERPALIDRFARVNGFSKDGNDRYCHNDGGWLERAHGNGFHWEMRDKSGNLKQCFWLKDHCLEKEPLQIDASIWGLCEKSPALYSIVLANEEDEPEEISGYRLVKMRNTGEMQVHPATYRLVYKDECKNE